MSAEAFDPLRPGFNLSEAREHVSDIMFDPQSSPDPDCDVCKIAVGLGFWREFGVDDPFGLGEQ